MTEPMTEPTPSENNVPSFVRDVWSLGKPGLSSLVIFTTGGGMFLAGGEPTIGTVLAGMIGTTMVVASANSLNNYIERESDKLMARTRTRPLPDGRIEPWVAMAYGIVLMVVAVPWMVLHTTTLAATLAVIAWATYVFVYTPLKRRSWLSVLVGGIAGAMPPLIGWTAVTGSIDPRGLALFSILFLWQLPHSLAITLYRKSDYDAAGLKILPTEMNEAITRQHILAYVVGLVATSLWIVSLGLGGAITLAGAAGLGGVFLWKAWRGLQTEGGSAWARDLFLYSLVYLCGLFAVMAVDHVL
jgi:protoheme IX farnesyltransferase